MNDYWATPDPHVILCFLAIPLLLLGVMIATLVRDRKCSFRTNGGMHCSKARKHDGPHSFTNAEWRRTAPKRTDVAP